LDLSSGPDWTYTLFSEQFLKRHGIGVFPNLDAKNSASDLMISCFSMINDEWMTKNLYLTVWPGIMEKFHKRKMSLLAFIFLILIHYSSGKYDAS